MGSHDQGSGVLYVDDEISFIEWGADVPTRYSKLFGICGCDTALKG